MKKLLTVLCSAAMTVGSLAVPAAPAFSMPMPSAGFETQTANLQEIRYRRGFHRPYYYPRYYRHGFHGRYRGYRHGGWLPGAFIAGAIIGGAIATAPYRYHHRPYRGYDYYYQGRCSGWRGDCW